MSDRLDHFKEAWLSAFRRAPLPLTITPRIVVDMGSREKEEIRTTVAADLQAIGPLLQRFENRFNIRLTVAPEIHGSALVNPFDSSSVVADRIRETRSAREDKLAGADPKTARLLGLAALLQNVRGYAAPRDDIDYSNGGSNRIGSTFLAVQNDGQIVSSVGPNSLMDLRDSTKRLWSVDPAFWAATY